MLRFVNFNTSIVKSLTITEVFEHLSSFMSNFLKLSVFLSGIITIALSIPAQAAVTTQCQIQPREGQPSPLAMRALFTLESTPDGNVAVTYTNLPTPVGVGQPVTIEQTRKMIFYKSTIPAVRQQMLSNPTFFTELRGFSDPEGFKPFNDLLVCQSVGADKPQSGTPQSGTPQPGTTIADLIDGSYRYWNSAPSMNVTDKQIKPGNFIFLFTKEGNRVVGVFARPDDLAVCMTGTVKGNTISGVVNPPVRFSDAEGRSRQNKPFDPAGYLKLGAWSNAGNLGAFSSSTLDLSKFNRINIGPRKAPSICR
jgi:hypothetical protein